MTEAGTKRHDEETEDLRLVRGPDGELRARTPGRTVLVRPARCFPWSRPTRWISLRDAEDEEVALVRELSDLGPESQAALGAALVEAGFVFEVEAVLAVEEELEIRVFRVRTKQGPRRFQTLRDEWPRELPDGSLLFEDVAGDLYRVSDPAGLDRRSRKLLWPFVD